MIAKGNQPGLVASLEKLFDDIHGDHPDHEEYDRGHARVESRRIWVKSIPVGLLHDGFALGKQAFLIERRVTDLQGNNPRIEAVLGFTSRSSQHASSSTASWSTVRTSNSTVDRTGPETGIP